MSKRKTLSKKLRFEVFKRDGFTCQYCGRTAPAVVLHADHMKPVKANGKNTILNLIFYKTKPSTEQLEKFLRSELASAILIDNKNDILVNAFYSDTGREEDEVTLHIDENKHDVNLFYDAKTRKVVLRTIGYIS